MTDIDLIQINFDPEKLVLLNFILGFLTFGVALDIRFDDFRTIFRQPKKIIVGLISQWLLLPVFTLMLIFFFQPPASVALGLALIAACPGGNVSNYATHLARGNTALSVAMTSFVTLAALVSTPMIFGIVTQLVPATAELLEKIALDPFAVLTTIVQLIIIPLALGLYLGNRKPNLANYIRRPAQIFSLVIFVALIVGAVLGNIDAILNHLHHVFLIVIVHNCFAYIIGYYFAKANKLPEPDRRTIAIETGIQNAGLGLVIIFGFFQELGGMMLVAAWWGVWDLISVLLLGIYWNKKGLSTKVAETNV